MKVALDTNVLAYAEGVNGADRRAAALEVVRHLPSESACIPVQVLGELFNVLVRKAGRTRSVARDALLAWSDAFPLIPTSSEVAQTAADLSADHKLSIRDAVVIAASSHAGCRLLLSEDLQNGFTWGGVTIVDPFARKRHALLDSLLDD